MLTWFEYVKVTPLQAIFERVSCLKALCDLATNLPIDKVVSSPLYAKIEATQLNAFAKVSFTLRQT